MADRLPGTRRPGDGGPDQLTDRKPATPVAVDQQRLHPGCPGSVNVLHRIVADEQACPRLDSELRGKNSEGPHVGLRETDALRRADDVELDEETCIPELR